MSAPSGAEISGSLVEILQRWARERSAEAAFTFLDGEGAESDVLDYGSLDRRARAVAARLLANREAGDRALLLFAPGLDFVVAFLGCLYAGILAVPSSPPRPRREQPRLRSLAADCRPGVILTSRDLEARARGLVEEVPDLADAELLAVDAIPDDSGSGWRPRFVPPEAPAFLQYTSGSTGEPRGVIVTHGGLLHNEALIRRAFDQSASSVVVGWLPLFHDMGLIGNVLQPLYVGAKAILMSPVSFLQRPLRWLEAISRYRATTSGGPDFAYELCVRRIGEEEREELDLSSWRVAFNGSEPVRADTLERFARAFAPCGFRPEALLPCYGLAEATLFVSASRTGEPPVVRAFETEALQRGRGVLSDVGPEPNARRLVASGRAGVGERVAVLDPESRRPRPPGQVGEIWVRGESVAAGYWRKERLNQEVFQARTGDGSGPYLRTGDLGFLHGGHLYVTGRLKDLLIVRGRNHYPQDLEATAHRAHPALRPGGAAAFSVERDGGETVVLVQEVERGARRERLPEAAEAVRRAVAEEHEVALDEVVLVRRGQVPTTSSGKVRRSACRAALEGGELEVLVRSSLRREERRGLASGAGVLRVPPDLGELPPGERRTAVERYLEAVCAEVTGLAGDAPPDAGSSLAALGLDSLGAAQLRNAVEAELGVSLSLESLLAGRTLGELAAEIALALGGTPGARSSETGAPEEAAPGAISPGQRALWLAERIAPARGLYNLAGAARADGPVPVEALRRALERLVERHGALRTTFHDAGGEPVGRTAERLPPEVRLGEPGLPEEVPRYVSEEARRPFDLEAGPLVRLCVRPLEGGGVLLVLALHHLVADFWSLDVLLAELELLFLEETGGPPADLPPLRATYAELVGRRHRLLAGREGERAREFWRERIGGGLPVLDLPTDRPRARTRIFSAGAVSLRLDPEASAALETLARSSVATPFAVLLGAYQLLLGRYAGSSDVAVLCPVAARDAADLEGLVGYCADPVPVRTRRVGGETFEHLCGQVAREVRAVLDYQGVPAGAMIEELGGGPRSRETAGPPVPVLFVLHRSRRPGRSALAALAAGEPGVRLALGDLALESVAVPPGSTEFELGLTAARLDDRYLLRLEYAAELFDPTTARRALGHLRTLLAAALADPRRPVERLPLLSAAEWAQVIREGQGTPAVPAPDALLHALVGEQAARTPDAVALVSADERLSYGELLRRVRRLASRLAAFGVGPEVPVAVTLARGPDLPVALLAVLEAGGAYVPIDPDYPAERRALMVKDSGARLAIAGEPDGEWLAALGVVAVPPGGGAEPAAPPAERSSRVSGDNLAYLIYTSGSTGRPKGVAITHANAVALVAWALRRFGGPAFDGILASTSVCFDLSVFELFAPLAAGGKVVLAEDALALPFVPAAHEVRTLNTVPSAAAELVRSDGLPPSVEWVLLAGEPLRRSLADALHARPGVVEVLNLYGPSEDTTYSTVARVEAGTAAAPTVGRPVDGTSGYVTGPDLEPVPAGVVGELLLGGAGVTRGYLGRPGLSAERYLPDPFSRLVGGRLYRTGDRVRRRSDGEIEFLGRLDHQVKIRGFRIEPGEVEEALTAHPAVAEAVVDVAGGDADPALGPAGERHLVAYVVPSPGTEAAPEELRGHLMSRLPGAFLPSAFVTLEEVPRHPNGKVDRSRLPAPGPARRPALAPPRSRTESVLVEIWEEALEAGRVGIHDDFFAVGGNSLLGSRILARVRERLGVDLPLSALFEALTVAALAPRVEAGGRRAGEDLPAGARPTARPPERRGEPAPLSFAQERLWVLHRLEPDSAAYHMAGAVDLDGRLDAAAAGRALNELARRHEVLRTRFPAIDGAPVQVVAPPARVPLPVVGLDGLAPAAASREAGRLEVALARRPFDLSEGPVWRAALLRMGPAGHRLVVTLHHVAGDESSLDLLAGELTVLLEAAAMGHSSPLPPPPLQYADVAAWQRARAGEAEVAEDVEWWRDRLADLEPLELPTDRPRPPVRSARGGTAVHFLDSGLADRLRGISREGAGTLFEMLLAGFAALLSRLTGSADVAVGTPMSSRDDTRLEGVLGFLVDTVVVRIDCGGRCGFRELARRVRAEILAAREHRRAPFELLVERLQPTRSLDRNPLFDVLFALQRPPRPARAGGLRLVPRPVPTGTSKFDLGLFGVEGPAADLSLSLEYSADLFDPTTARRVLGHLECFLAAAAAAPEAAVAELPLMSPGQRHAVLVEWQGGPAPHPAPVFPHRFAARAAAEPDAVALVHGGGRVTYGELARRVSVRAGWLRGLGVGRGDLVAVVARRTPALVEAMLAIQWLGAAYAPIDPTYPPPRVAFLLRDSGARRVLVDRRSAASLPPRVREAVLLEDGPAPEAGGWDPPAEILPEELAYVVYTSGSTGTPKGVGIRHAGLAALVGWAEERFGPGVLRGVLASTSVCFDLSAFELFVPLALGGTVVLADDALSLPEVPDAAAVTLVNTVPSAMSALLAAGPLPPSIRWVNLAGEALSRELADEVLARPQIEDLYNLYGPSEDTTYSTEARVVTGEPAPSIGRPLPGTTVHLLDPGLRPVPPGVTGGLYLRGPGLARGYLRRPGPTAARFLPDPLAPAPGARAYWTGDLARRLPDGRLHFLGRVDRQVKVRGYRVELGEVESTLGRHPALAEAAVVSVDDRRGETSLVAYVVPRGPGGDAEDLERYLAKRLPAYLVPSLWVHLPRLPRTPNGKLDRRALPAPDVGGGRGRPAAARTPVEAIVLEIWKELLPAGVAGVHDDFFRVGGHSLLAMRLISRVREATGVDLGIRTVFEERTVARLARRIEVERRSAPPLERPPIEPRGDDGPAPLSFSQERLWFLDRLDGGGPVYNLPVVLRIAGALHLPALRRSLACIVRRHEALRTAFRVDGGRPVQVVRPPAPVPVPVVDLRGLPAGRRAREVSRESRREALSPFDLAADALLRLRLLRCGPEDHRLLLTVHHIVADGWSLGVLMGELEAEYAAEVEGRSADLPSLPIQYADFALWRRRWLEEADLGPELEFWRRTLADAPAILELPTDRPRPPLQSHRGGSWRAEVEPAVAAALDELDRGSGATLFMILVAAFAVLLRRITGRNDLVLGTPTAGRPTVETERLIGLFADSLVLRVVLEGDPTFEELLGRVRSTLIDAYAHQEIPFERLVEELHPRRDLSHNPIYQVVIALEERLRPEPDLVGLEVAAAPPESVTAKFDLALYMERGGRGLTGLLEYNRDLFDGTTAARMLRQFTTVLASAAAGPSRRVSTLPLLAAPERHQLLVEANDTARPEPAQSFVCRDFEAWAAAAPHAPAVRAGARVLTYGELDRRANGLAHRLRHLGVGPDVPVAVSMGREPELLVALLGILKAGGAYLPLDPDYPPDRLAFMLEDSGSPVVVTGAGGEPPVAGVPVVRCDAGDPEGAPMPPAVDLDPGHLAYLIYTSGSTGRPKGVAVSHRSLASYTATAAGAYGIGPGDRVLQFCSISFDISLEEIVPCLSRGGELVLRSDAMVASVDAFADASRDLGLTVLSLPTAFWHQIAARLDAGGPPLPPSLRLVIIAGERALPERLETWLRHAPESPRLINTYGLTESTIISTVGDLTACGAPDPGREVPIGRTVPDTELLVLDDRLQPVPHGVPGELFIGGGLLARGYLGRFRITAERFVPHPFAEEAGARAYRTGDLARTLAGGDLEFLGRSDHQVKVRGYRIELGEVEAALVGHPDVAGAVVARVEERPGDARLVAYLVPADGQPPSVPAIQRFLRASLPEYMVPGRFLVLDRLPLTPNGKVDRAALPRPDGDRPELEAEYVAPRDELERLLAEIWAGALGLDRVGVHDNFFDLGGHSLLLVQVHEGIRSRLGRELPLVELFAHPTVSALADRMAEGAPEEEPGLDDVRERAARRRETPGRDRYREARRRVHG